MKINRRKFVQNTLAGGVALSAPTLLRSQSEKYKTALIGSGWWGTNIAEVALASGQVTIAAICDVDQNQLQKSSDHLQNLSGVKPKWYTDYRELLQREKPEIAIVATSDHWHALTAIAAMEAGADVYVEKPISHTILEGRAMVNTARNHGRVVQVGTHRRTSPHNMEAIQFVKDGGAGTIGMIRAFVHSNGGAGRLTPDSEPPEGLDWDFWCGPAPFHPYNRRMHPRGFRQFLDFGNGTLGDWGIHWMDHILWWSEEKYPKTIQSIGSRHIKQDNTTAPDTQVVIFEFDSFTATWEHRHYGGNDSEKHRLGIYFYGTKGIVHIGWHDGWTFYPSSRNGQLVHGDPHLHEPDSQNIPELWANFLDCIKTRNKPICDIEIGHLSSNLSLLGMLSYKLGRSVTWDGESERFPNDPEADALLKREYRAPWQYPQA